MEVLEKSGRAALDLQFRKGETLGSCVHHCIFGGFPCLDLRHPIHAVILYHEAEFSVDLTTENFTPNRAEAYPKRMKSDAATSPEFDRFTALVDQVLSVPKAEVQRGLADYKRESDANPHKRGPKRKDSARPESVKTA